MRNEIKRIFNPNYKKQTVDVEFKNGETATFPVYQNPSNSYYLFLDGERLYLYDFKDGEWLERMLN